MRCAMSDRDRRGAVAVELALLMPFFATIILGVTEIGQVQRAQCYVSEAAYAGCTMGSQLGSSNSLVISDVKASLTSCKMTANSAVITIKVNDVVADVSSAKLNDKVTVKVSIPVSATSWFGSHCFIPANSTISKTVVMMKQG